MQEFDLIWVSRFTHKETMSSQGIHVSVACQLMSMPSHKVWKHNVYYNMQMVAWLRDHKKSGMRFRSDNSFSVLPIETRDTPSECARSTCLMVIVFALLTLSLSLKICLATRAVSDMPSVSAI